MATALILAALVCDAATAFVSPALAPPGRFRVATRTSWDDVSAQLPSALAEEPRTIDSVLSPMRPAIGAAVSRMALFRERNGWCPYSQRVWLGAEWKQLDFDTVLIDNMGVRPPWFSGQTPQVMWADGKTQGESVDLLRALDERFPDTPRLFPEGAESEVTNLINEFRNCFPRNTRPSSRAAFLFRSSGSPMFRSEFEKTLDATDAILARLGGPFFLGEEFTAADCAWAPFLERYAAQLPLLHDGLDPRSPERQHLAAWYRAMETQVPAYARTQGDATSWAKVLEQAGYGNAGQAPTVLGTDLAAAVAAGVDEEDLANWRTFAASRPYVADTPVLEAAARLVRNRVGLAKDAVRMGFAPAEEAALDGLRGVVAALLLPEPAARPAALSNAAAAQMARYLDSRMCVPRDMGRLPAWEIRWLARALGD